MRFHVNVSCIMRQNIRDLSSIKVGDELIDINRELQKRVTGPANSHPARLVQALRVLVPFVGMLFVIHLAEHDRHRFVEEWCLDWERLQTNSSSGC